MVSMQHFCDYHMHSSLSEDSQTPMANQIRQAISLGLREICITEHFDFDPCEYSPNLARPGDPRDGYIDDLLYDQVFQQCQNQYGSAIRLRQGAEVGEPHRFPNEARAILKKHSYDFVLGSIHLFQGNNISSPWLDVPATAKEAYETFFSGAWDLAGCDIYDVMAHLDIIKRHSQTYYGPFDPTEYADPIRQVLRRLISNGRGIEINTSGLRQNAKETLPGLTILQWYKELGGEILTVGSDAHRAEHVGFGLDSGRELALAAGLKYYCTYEQRKPFFHSFL